jgi:hypothetical protein
LVGIAAAQLAGEDFLVGLDRQRADTAGQQLAPVWSRGQQRWSTRGVVAISMFPSWSRIRRVSGDGRDQAHPRPTEPQDGSRALGHLAVPLSRDRMKPDASPVTRATISGITGAYSLLSLPRAVLTIRTPGRSGAPWMVPTPTHRSC